MRLLMMLMQNGLSLPKSLTALCEDRAAKKWIPLLSQLRSAVQQGGSLSDAMAKFPGTFNPMQVQQIRIGERTGELERALGRIFSSVERKVQLRRKIIQRISYPILICFAGFGLIIFMVTFVVPQFEDVFSSSGVTLPLVTRVVTGLSRFLLKYGIWIAGLVGALLLVLRYLKRHPKTCVQFDGTVLRIPIVGEWFRDAAVLQFSEAVTSMIESGYTPVDAVQAAIPCVRNRAVRRAVERVRDNVMRGERLSIELSRCPKFFPATLCQMISVGEKSGDFGRAMGGACNHLQTHLERRVDATVSAIEPILDTQSCGSHWIRGHVNLHAHVQYVRGARVTVEIAG
jgi:type II secretory pathway component PulF